MTIPISRYQQPTWADLFDGEPIPLTSAQRVPPFPVDALPPSIADMVDAVAMATQTDSAMAATSAMTALSACTGGRALIEIRPGWREPLNLFTATVAKPAERKSAVHAAMTRPLLAAEKQLVEASRTDRIEAQSRKHIAEQAAERAKQLAVKASGTDDSKEVMDKAIHAAGIAEGIEVPAIPRLVADDATPEAIASLMAEQGGRIAIISAEPGIFGIIAGRYSGSANLEPFLKGHAGDPIKIDRKGRGPEFIEQPALTIGVMIQPFVLSDIAANREFRGRGLLDRFLFAFPVSRVGHRMIGAPPAAATTITRYEETVVNLAVGLAGRAADPVVLSLTEDAARELLAIERQVEASLAEDGELYPLVQWGGKYVGAIARIAGILHLADRGPMDGPLEPIEVEVIDLAHEIGFYYRACAMKAFTELAVDEVTADAVYLLSRIGRLGLDELTERQMHQATDQRIKTKAKLMPALQWLIDFGWVARIPTETPSGPGRRPSPRYRLHPRCTESTESTQR